VQEHGSTSIANLSSWLFRVTHNLVMDLGRKKERDQRVMENAMQQAILTQRDEESDDTSPGSPGDLEHREICGRAMAELHRLPDDQKNVLLLKIGQGMSLRQISEVTGLSPGNAGYRINLGLREIARRLKETGAI
jgi:RNA polymerase sigma factor (sigma-70 family)